MNSVAAGTSVIVLAGGASGPGMDRPSLVPAQALRVVRAAAAVYQSDVDFGVPAAPPVDMLLAEARAAAVVLVTGDLDAEPASALRDAGAEVVGPPPGGELLSAVAVMDRLRSPGGCPWDAEQTHDSLRQYLVEECFELLEAIEDGDRAALREELGDVLLQVLFHARLAAEDAEEPFTVDDVAAALVAKLVGRHPYLFAGLGSRVRDADSQQRQWDELKVDEKRRESSVDGVPLAQPALALAGKLAKRTARAGLPGDLLPAHEDAGSRLFALAAVTALAGTDPEGELRAVARRFAADVRAAERAARAAGVDPSTMDHATWRSFWPVS